MTKTQPKKIAILQTTRFGDLIQTTQACHILRQNYPDYEIVLIARKKFAEPLDFLLKKTFHRIYKFETKNFFSYEGKKDIKKTSSQVESFIKKVSSEKFNLLINLSFSKSSSYMAHLIEAEQKIGLMRNSKSQLIVEDVWSQYIFSNVMRGTSNPYNIVDLFKKILGVSFIKNDKRPKTLELNNTIVIHPFASQARKKWGHSKWIEVFYHILKNFNDYKISVVGGKEDIDQIQYFKESKVLEKYQSRIEYNVGNRDIKELYQQLESSRLFVGHDSMVGHLAAEAQTPSITISLGTVRPHETTPYQENAINISPAITCFPCQPSRKCELLPCHGQVSYRAVCDIVNLSLNSSEISYDSIKNSISLFNLEGINIYKSYDPGHGELELEELTTTKPNINSLFKTFYKIMWSFVLSDVELSSNTPQISSKTKKELKGVIDGITGLYELYRFGATFSKQLMEDIESNKDLNLIRANFKKINEINELTRIIRQGHPLLAPIIDFFFVSISNIQGDGPLEIAKSSLIIFNNAQNAVSVLYELAMQVNKVEESRHDKNDEKIVES